MDLETALNMKPGSIYAAFTNKETLHLLALERYFERSRTGFRKLAADAKTPLVCLAVAINAGQLPGTADPQRLALRYHANVAALRLEMAKGSNPDVVATLAEEIASEIVEMATPAH